MTLREILQRRDAVRAELRGILDKHTDGVLPEEVRQRADELEDEAGRLNDLERRQVLIDELDRRTTGQPLNGTGDGRLETELSRVGILDAVRAQLGMQDHGAGRAREMSQELARRSGRQPQGIYWSMAAPANVERRVLTTAAPAGGPGGNLVGTDLRPDLFIDRLRNGTVVRRLGARVLADLSGNLAIPRRTGSVAMGWVAENSPLSVDDPAFDQVTMSPKHAGVITEWSRNMVLQTSPDVEQLARDDMALQLGETLDAAAIIGTGSANQPRGILHTSGIGSVSMGATGGALTLDAVSDLIGQVEDRNADIGSLAFLSNSKVRRAAAKLKDGQQRPYGLDTVFQGIPRAFNNLVPSDLTKSTGSGLSALIYANWSDLLIAIWGPEVDLLINPYESTAYSKGNIQVRALMSCDIAVRHPESFAAIVDLSAP